LIYNLSITENEGNRKNKLDFITYLKLFGTKGTIEGLEIFDTSMNMIIDVR